jgi:hypothetical protein
MSDISEEAKRAIAYTLADSALLEWRRASGEAGTWDTIRARDLMIEFVGGEPAEQLRGQFA